MPEYLAPGVYVEEVGFRSRPIEGVPTDTTGLLGVAERGPLHPVLVHGVAEFERRFGRGGAGGHLADAVRGYFDNGGQRLVVCRVVGRASTTAAATFGGWQLRAVGPGGWGNRVWARLDLPAAGVVRLRLAWWEADPPGGLFDPFQDDAATLQRLAASPPAVQEDFQGVRPGDAGAPASTLVTLLVAGDAGPQAASAPLAGGTDVAPGVADFEGRPETAPGCEPQGLAALDDDPEGQDVALLAAPGATIEVARALVAHAERAGHRLVVLDLPLGGEVSPAEARARFGDTRWAVVVAPWLKVAGPAGAAPRSVPPSGHVLGCLARLGSDRGVWKAPLDGPLQGVVGVAEALLRVEADAMLQQGVNPIRQLPGRGFRVMGARTLSSEPEHRQLAVRRLLNFLQRSLDRGLQDVVFEPHGEALWHRVRARVQDFLFVLWREGALQGTTPDEAYFVRCDRTTMTQADIDEGRLIVLVGVAIARPSEFVVFRIGQFTADRPR